MKRNDPISAVRVRISLNVFSMAYRAVRIFGQQAEDMDCFFAKDCYINADDFDITINENQ